MYEQLHQNELLELAIDDRDQDAVTELMRRQREGASLRLYPHGRNGPDDEGYTPMSACVPDDAPVVEIEVGRTLTGGFGLTKGDCEYWIVALAEVAASAVRGLHESAPHLSTDALRAMVQRHATEDFACFVVPVPANQMMYIHMKPGGQRTWRLGLLECEQLISNIALACEVLEWQLDITKDQAELVRAFVVVSNRPRSGS